MASDHDSLLSRLLPKRVAYGVGLALTDLPLLVAFIDPILNHYKQREYFVVFAYCTFLLFAAVTGIVLRPKRPPPPAPKKGVFVGVGRVEERNAWPRYRASGMLCDAIESSRRRPIVLVGESGVGKTVLLESQVLPQLNRSGWKTVLVSEYENLPALVLAKLVQILPQINHEEFLIKAHLPKGPRERPRIVFVFDQFEQLFVATDNHMPASTRAHVWFREFVQAVAKNALDRVLIAVRKEWYYDLRFLQGKDPSPSHAHHLTGLSSTVDNTSYDALRHAIKTVTKNDETAALVLKQLTREDGTVLPVEAQMVGLMLENEGTRIGEITVDHYQQMLGGKDGLLRRYFRQYLDASPDPDGTLQILFALSVETSRRDQLRLGDLAYILHKSTDELCKPVDYLKEKGLILELRVGRYELAHDYLAQAVHQFTGVELDPVERDNIVFFRDHAKSQRQLPGRGAQAQPESNSQLGWWIMTLLALLLLARLFGPLYGIKWGWFDSLTQYVPRQRTIDLYYLPVFVSHLAWSIYVTLLYQRFLSRLQEERGALWLSRLTVLVCAGAVVTAAFVRDLWLFSIGIGGLTVGLKLLQLSATKGLGQIGTGSFRSIGIRTLANTAIVTAFGLAYAFYARQIVVSEPAAARLNAFDLLVAIVMTYYMLHVAPGHITRAAAAKMRGLINRRPLD